MCVCVCVYVCVCVWMCVFRLWVVLPPLQFIFNLWGGAVL